MEANGGYQTLAMLLRKKTHLIKFDQIILDLIFTMAGTLDAGKEVVGIPNLSAFRDLLCDLDLWHAAELEKSLFEHFHELITARNSMENVRILREFSIVEKLLSILKKLDSSRNPSATTLLKLIHGLLCASPRVSDVLCFALFTAATLEVQGDEKCHAGTFSPEGTDLDQDSTSQDSITDRIILRNRCLKLFHSLLYCTGENESEVHINYCEDVAQVVGFDWVLLFVQGHLHQTTVVWGLRILATLLSLPQLMIKFRTGICNGHWLMKSENVLHNKMVEALGGQGSSTNSTVSRSNIRMDLFLVPGFQHLNWLMPHHITIPDVYFLLAAIILGRPVKGLPSKVTRLDLDSIWEFVFKTKASDVQNQAEINEKIRISGDAMETLLVMVRKLFNSVETLPEWLSDYPMLLTQFLFYLYHNVPEFIPAFMTSEVLTALVGTLFPLSTNSSDQSTPEEEPSIAPDTPEDIVELTSHPAKKNVMNFMRVIIVDSLSLLSSPKNPPVIDLLIDAEPPHTNVQQRSRFQTEMLGVLMDHLLAADVLIGKSSF